MGEWERKIPLSISQGWDNVDPNVALGLTSILTLPQMVSISQRSCDIPLIGYSKSIIMTSNEHTASLEHKQERYEEVEQEEQKRNVDLKVTKNCNVEDQKERKRKK